MFTWTNPDDETVVITLPDMGDIPAGVMRSVRKLDDVDAMFALIEGVADEATLATIDTLPVRLLNDLFKAWAGGVGPGESAGSST